MDSTKLADANKRLSASNKKLEQIKQALDIITVSSGGTYTPTSTDKVISTNTLLKNDLTIKGDPNLRPENIKAGVSMFGVNGNCSTGITMSGIAEKNISICYNTTLIRFDVADYVDKNGIAPEIVDVIITDLSSSDIREGTTMFGIEGTCHEGVEITGRAKETINPCNSMYGIFDVKKYVDENGVVPQYVDILISTGGREYGEISNNELKITADQLSSSLIDYGRCVLHPIDSNDMIHSVVYLDISNSVDPDIIASGHTILGVNGTALTYYFSGYTGYYRNLTDNDVYSNSTNLTIDMTSILRNGCDDAVFETYNIDIGSHIKPGDIRSGVTIFGVTGTYTGG